MDDLTVSIGTSASFCQRNAVVSAIPVSRSTVDFSLSRKRFSSLENLFCRRYRRACPRSNSAIAPALCCARDFDLHRGVGRFRAKFGSSVNRAASAMSIIDFTSGRVRAVIERPRRTPVGATVCSCASDETPHIRHNVISAVVGGARQQIWCCFCSSYATLRKAYLGVR